MKQIIIALCLLFYNVSFGQNDSISEIEKKYSYVEIWGLKNQTKKDFLEKIIKCPGGICESSLKLMGYNDGNKIPLAFSNKIIVTLRSIPDYKIFPIYNKKIKVANNETTWKDMINAINGLSNYEKQQLPIFLDAFKKSNQKAVDSLFILTEQEFKSYGIQLKKEKISAAFKVYQSFTKSFTKDEVVDVLFHSEDSAKNEAAQFIASDYLKTANDLLDFLPLLLKKKSGTQSIITAFIHSNNEKIDWNNHMPLLKSLVNNPNPFQAILALKIADKTGFTKSNMKILLNTELITIKEILKSNALNEEKQYVLGFLNQYTGYNSNVDAWLNRL
jgi:hypothetical protein